MWKKALKSYLNHGGKKYLTPAGKGKWELIILPADAIGLKHEKFNSHVSKVSYSVFCVY